MARQVRTFVSGNNPSDEETDLRRFLTWSLGWVVLANAGFAAMWFVGAPPRHTDIAITGIVGLIVKRLPTNIQWLSFIAVVTYSLLSFLSSLFNLRFLYFINSLQFFTEIHPANSIEYLIGLFLVLTILFFARRLFKRDTNFKNPLLLIAAAGVVAIVMTVDIVVTKGTLGHYNRKIEVNAPFESAVKLSGFDSRLTDQRHLLLVMIESLGLPTDNPELQNKLFSLYFDKKVTDLYELKTGETLYYNSTTTAELRELCGLWGDYGDYLDHKDSSCLPAMLESHGYATTAIHGFNSSFFQRNEWYPNLGFQHMRFWDNLKAEGARYCGGVFPGACDRDVPSIIGEILKEANSPQFVYWLTLNAHIPVPTGNNLNVENCNRISLALNADAPMICRQFAIFDDTDRALVAEITGKDFPVADILIVGDHAPPYFDRYYRLQFDSQRVPWLYLRRKD